MFTLLRILDGSTLSLVSERQELEEIEVFCTRSLLTLRKVETTCILISDDWQPHRLLTSNAGGIEVCFFGQAKRIGARMLHGAQPNAISISLSPPQEEEPSSPFGSEKNASCEFEAFL